ncbi:CTP synthase C-terminal region-related (seleno)protein [Leeia oryzae]|uniref:CTP synthase C-terminal region-related (seleno)protein n=1 Tax=Leeia oryzae TaxID=356662 RepID=UPI000375946A|nr:hypothetical protein [Leeia oryzae]
MPTIYLIGDFNAHITAHNAINASIAIFNKTSEQPINAVWLGTEHIHHAQSLADADGVWCVPGSPYKNPDGVFKAIRYARERQIPFLGTCGGFQHAIIEFARHAKGVDNASHAEETPDAKENVISALSCSLVETGGEVIFPTDSILRKIYMTPHATEMYHCNYGVNKHYYPLLFSQQDAMSGLRIAAVDEQGDVRAVQYQPHPFFVATLYQPERRALGNSVHPLCNAFFDAVIYHQQQAERTIDV